MGGWVEMGKHGFQYGGRFCAWKALSVPLLLLLVLTMRACATMRRHAIRPSDTYPRACSTGLA